MIEKIDYIHDITGLNENQAGIKLAAHGILFRTAIKNNKQLPLTAEFNPLRVNVEVKNDIIIKILGVY